MNFEQLGELRAQYINALKNETAILAELMAYTATSEIDHAKFQSLMTAASVARADAQEAGKRWNDAVEALWPKVLG